MDPDFSWCIIIEFDITTDSSESLVRNSKISIRASHLAGEIFLRTTSSSEIILESLLLTLSTTSSGAILSFKPESDDIRQTPALEIIKLLLEAGYKNIIAYDPMANKLFDSLYHLPISYANSTKECIEKSEAIVVATGWKEFIANKELITEKKVYDLRYIF